MRAGSPVSVGGIVAGKYRIGAVVGFTGMGIACAGVHLDLGTKVEVLFAHPEDASDPRAVARFLQGARTAAQLRSQHARRVLDCGQLATGEPYLVLEFLEGADLRSIVTTHGSLPVEETSSFVLQACDALGEAHARGLVHGDVRPENLFLTRGADGSALVKVLGLEFATELRATSESRAPSASLDSGPYRHLSPEQLSDANSVDARADIWALGVLLYELLTGVLPFEGGSAAEVRDSVISNHPCSPRDFDAAISKGLGEVVLRCLEKNPDTRFPDAATLGAALRAFGASTASMGAARVEDVLRYARSIRPARDASPSVPPARRASSVPPLSRASTGGHASATAKLPSVPRATPAATPPASSEAIAVSGQDSTESVRSSWLMDPPGSGTALASSVEDSEDEDSEEFVRPSWLMDPPDGVSEPEPETPRASATKPPPIPASSPSAAVTPPRLSAPPRATSTPPPMPVASPSAPKVALTPAGARTLPSIPAVSPPATSKPPPLPLPSVTTPPPLPVTSRPREAPAAKGLGGVTLPAVPASLTEFAAAASAWVVKHRRAVLAATGGLVLALGIALVARTRPGPAAEPSAPPSALAATSAVAPVRPVAPPAAPSAVRVASAPSATPKPEPKPPASSAVAPPQERARTATPRPKRPRQSNLYPVLKPPNL